SLSFGEDGVDGERAFARSAGAGQHDQFVARDVDVDVAQIVDASAAHTDALAIERGLAIGRRGGVAIDGVARPSVAIAGGRRAWLRFNPLCIHYSPQRAILRLSQTY